MPTTGLHADTLQDAVELACRAPSFHNSQPWRWVLGHGRLHLFIDPDRIVDTDKSGRETLISCGAVLDHLRVAAAAAGWTATVERYPNPDDPTLLAAIDFTPLTLVTDAHRRRADAILRRRTDRLPFAAPPDWESFDATLRDAIGDSGALLDVLTDDVRPQVAEASQLSEALRMYDSPYHAELAWWTAPFAAYDGIPPTSLVSAEESDRVDVGRSFPVINHQDRRQDLPEDHSKIVILSVAEDIRANVLRCGEALSAVLLECTMAGLASCTLTHVIEVAASRDVITSLIAQPYPQVVIRVGVAPAGDDVPPPTPRRPVADVLHFRV